MYTHTNQVGIGLTLAGQSFTPHIIGYQVAEQAEVMGPAVPG